MYKTTYAVGNEADDAFVTPAPVYSGAHTSAPGHTVESEAGWNNWWHANFDAQMEHRIIPAVGDAMGMIGRNCATRSKDCMTG
jgi:hypothetical protein